MTDANWRSTDDYWEDRYRQAQTGWDRGKTHTALMKWLKEGTIQPCRVLIPGCGNGYEVLHLASLGFDVTAVDFADTPIESVTSELVKTKQTADLIQADLL